MRSIVRRTALATLSVAVTVLSAAAVAWACSPQATLTAKSSQVEPGGTVVLEGEKFVPADVEIRWQAVDGPVLATVQGPQFTAEVSIPDVPSGSYVILGIARNQEGGIVGKPSASIRVGSGPAAEPQESTSTSGASDSTVTSGSTGTEATGGRHVPETWRGTGRTATDNTATEVSVPFGDAEGDVPVALAPQALEAPESHDVRSSRTKIARQVSFDLGTGFDPLAEKGPSLNAAGQSDGATSNAASYMGAGLIAIGAIAILAGLWVDELRRRRRAELVARDGD